ncbi:hypothetical protein GM418_13920 [Maribellus comscasis]|uniref:Nucleotidyltransferase domain-containing protein n=1 Tax=Maribellus comscasis TaxID=2681766 RepID=A0A6I6K427_9BACT|nr:hypothetical protein [Maribellus comscasis]QGY44724.1 hypothetical protein GM418_13920 [Maribellus comscasis]
MKKYSIIKFGSQLNSNFDKYSDKDLLVVADTSRHLSFLYEKYSSQGWSVSGYTYSKLKYLSNKGSLFISHLKKDSEILFDYRNKFQELLDSHQIERDFKNEIKGSKDYFDILRNIPDNQLGYAWFADCFYVGLRNYLIFKNAERNIFEFSYLNIIELLRQNCQVTETEYTLLRELRVVKFNYREDILDELPSKLYVLSLIQIARKLDLFESSNFIETLLFENLTLSYIKESNFNGYQRLRLIEGIYCAKEINIPEVKRIISNPQFYASRLMDNKFMMEIIRQLNKNATQHFVNLMAGKVHV